MDALRLVIDSITIFWQCECDTSLYWGLRLLLLLIAPKRYVRESERERERTAKCLRGPNVAGFREPNSKNGTIIIYEQISSWP